jgi:hypothetical protein
MHLTNREPNPHSRVVASEKSEATGAPEAEIEVTPEMIEAGEGIIWRALCGSILLPDVCPDELAKKVFEVMVEASQT